MYAMIGVELRTGRFSSNLEDGSVKTHLHTSPIVVKIRVCRRRPYLL